jgi:prepilin-type processing-associated H-X9-DG protein
MFEFRAVKLKEITDGTSNTLLLGEFGRGPLSIGNGDWFAAWGDGVQRLSCVGINRAYSAPLPYADRMSLSGQPPQQGPQTGLGFGSYHPGGVNFAFADGSVRFVKETTNLRVMSALGTRAGGEVVSASDY